MPVARYRLVSHSDCHARLGEDGGNNLSRTEDRDVRALDELFKLVDAVTGAAERRWKILISVISSNMDA